MPKIPTKIDHRKAFLYYRWVIVAISFSILTLAQGARQRFSVSYVAMLNEYELLQGTTATILSSHLIVQGLAAPLVGDFVDRYGLRKIFPIGGALIGLGLMACSTASTILEFILYFGIVTGLGISFLSATPHSPVLAIWWAKNKGLARGFALSGVGCRLIHPRPRCPRI